MVLLLLIALVLAGCGSITGNLAGNLSAAIRENSDLATVKDGGPAYLIMVDAFVMDDPSNPELLGSASNLYSTYCEVFVTDEARILRLTGKAFNYALRAACESNKELCGLDRMSSEAFDLKISSTGVSDTEALYTLGSAWAGWISARSCSIKAFAQIPRIETIMKRVVELNENHGDGSAPLYLGALAMILPPAVGGKPEVSRHHFERALELSGTKNLMARVLYAKKYARPMFDRELHDRLLKEVLALPAEIAGYTLINTLAKEQAQKLLDSGDDYF